MELRFLTESSFKALISENYGDDDNEYDTYNNERIAKIKWFVQYEKEFSDDRDNEPSSKEEFEAFQNNELDDEGIEQIDKVITAEMIETVDGFYRNVIWNALNYETPSDDISGDLADYMDDPEYYLSLRGYDRIIQRTEDGGYMCDFEPSYDINDIDSVNEYLEYAYGIDDYNPLYILTDGRGLSSDTQYGVRGRDHHLTMDEDSFTLDYLLRNGAIRMQPESPGFQLSVCPNQLQVAALKEWMQRYKGETFYLDISDENGDNTIASATYSRMDPRVVIAQIYRYFDEGIKPGEY